MKFDNITFMIPDNFTVQRQVEMDAKEPNYATVLSDLKKVHQDDALREVKDKVRDNPTPYETYSDWTALTNTPAGVHIYNLTVNVIFKP